MGRGRPFMEITKEILEALDKFNYQGEIKEIIPYGNGHINSTLLITTTKEKYIFQIINSYAFKNIHELMNNILLVTNHLDKKGAKTLKVIQTKDGQNYYEANEKYYRLYTYIENTVCYEGVSDLKMVEKSAIAFGQLHRLLEGLDPALIYETIKDFHNTPKRYENLMNAVERDEAHRLASCLEEVNYIKEQKEYLSLIIDGIKDGSVPNRITHNDTKINNVLFDKKTGDVACVIDLDTVMPGSALNDVGDGLRSLFTGDNEDSEDLSLLKVNFDMYKAYIKGYASQMKDNLTEREKELLPWSIFIIAIELASRFLEDYLNGDKYFHVSKPNHNLLRARTQIALAKDLMKHMKELEQITQELL